MLLSTAGYAYSNIPAVKNTIEDFLIEKVKVDTPTSPVISGGSEIWNKERIIKIEKDAKSGSGIKYYEYCVSSKKDMKNCRYKITTTKNAVINKTGKYYIAFRGVSNKGTKGKLSNIEYIAIDNEIPEINNVEIKEEIGKLKVKIDATDKLSGIGKILYQIDGETEKETTNEFELEITGEHILTIIVRDKVGNEVRISKNINISVKINDEQTPGEKNNEQNNNEETKNNDSENKNEENNTPGASEDENDNKKAPIINLNKVPKRIKIKDNYDLPSYYEFDKQGGEVRCELEDKTEVTNTKELELGNHTITCEAKGNNGLTTSTSKEIEVTTEENITWDGWMTLTLYYPENSTDWEYRVANENDVRDKESSWKEYTGPILIRLSQVDDVYIRYKLGGKTYIVNPKGKITVDIEPQSYEVGENQSTKITITYDENAKIKEYRIDGGEWTKYEKPFNIKGNTLIEARAIKEEKVYDSDGTYQYTTKRQGTDSVYIKRISNEITPGGTTPGGSTTNPDLPSNPEIDNIPGGNTTEKPMLSPTYLEGPTITNKQENEIVEETEVEITTKEKASKIYYSIGYGKYEEYKETLKVKENQVIRAYYIRESDGKRSDTSYYYVKNIKRPSYPYVKIDVEPSNYLDTIVTEAAVKISGQNYKKLEYSFDGNIWYTYENPLEIKESKTVYARAIDENLNIDLASTTITTIKPPKVYDKYEVSIHTNPKKEEVKGLINKTEITIDYDSRATKKYYKIGYYGELKEYNGSFTLDKNETIYAYAISDTGNGEAKLNINYLTTGISAPIINQNPEETSNSVKISIEYAKNAETKKYKINNGEWVDYTDEITINENCTIYAMNEDVLGNTNISSKRIKNIAYIPNYTLIDKGNYYIIHLNYPDSSNSDNREYKWTKNGKWKKYNNSLGILLIKQEGKNIISKDGVKIEDEKGKEIIYTDHYYLIDDISDNLMENLFMRWDTSKPAKPTFILSEEEPTKELEVAIIYDNTSKIKQYKIVKPTGEDSGWLDYNGPIKITDNKTVIYAKSQNSAEVWSETSNIKITNIDDEAPQIEARGELEKPRQKVTVQLVGKDNLGIDKVGYAKNNVDCSKATYIENMQTFTVEENGLYTICAKDKVGNTAKDLIEIKNIDKTAPDIAINILTKDYGNTLEFEIDYKDSKTKQYKIGNEEYKNYIGKVKIKSEDVLSQKNEDGSLTIYAKGIDEASNEKEVEETTYLIDLDAPKAPIITSRAGFPTLTEYGVSLGGDTIITYEMRDDTYNYYSLDDGATWKIYTGSFETVSGKIKAKSVKKISGLTVISEYTIPAISPNAFPAISYDNNFSSGVALSRSKQYRINIDKTLRGQKLYMKMTGSGYYYTFYDVDGQIIGSTTYGSNVTERFDIPENAYQFGFQPSIGGGGITLYEVYAYDIPIMSALSYFPVLTDYGMKQPYSKVTINYFKTSVKRLYKIDDGDWIEYNEPIKVYNGSTIYAKGIDKNGRESINNSSYVSNLISGAFPHNAYDDNFSTSASLSRSKEYKLNIDKSIRGKKLYIKMTGSGYYYSFYDKDGNNIVNRVYGNKVVDNFSIPENAYQFGFQPSSGGGGITVFEIYAYDIPIINRTEHGPLLTYDGIVYPHADITIDYFETSVKKLYKINDDEWQEYNGGFTIDNDSVVYAKGIDKNGRESVYTSNYKSVLVSGYLPHEGYDGNESTNKYISKSTQYRLDLDESIRSKKMYMKLSGCGFYYRFFDENKNEFYKNYSYDPIESFLIPENASYFTIEPSSGGCGIYIVEIDSYDKKYGTQRTLKARPVIENVKIDNPSFAINNLSTSEKEISITYPQGYTNEYSIDNGITWNLYTDIINVDKNLTIYARSIDESGKVVSSSSMKVTGIEEIEQINEQEENENEVINISEKILVGEDYPLPTEYKCYINDIEYTNTSTLEVGKYNVMCYKDEELIYTKEIEIVEENNET